MLGRKHCNSHTKIIAKIENAAWNQIPLPSGWAFFWSIAIPVALGQNGMSPSRQGEKTTCGWSNDVQWLKNHTGTPPTGQLSWFTSSLTSGYGRYIGSQRGGETWWNQCITPCRPFFDFAGCRLRVFAILMKSCERPPMGIQLWAAVPFRLEPLVFGQVEQLQQWGMPRNPSEVYAAMLPFLGWDQVWRPKIFKKAPWEHVAPCKQPGRWHHGCPRQPQRGAELCVGWMHHQLPRRETMTPAFR